MMINHVLFFSEKKIRKKQTTATTTKNFPRITMEVWHNLLTNKIKNILSPRSQT